MADYDSIDLDFTWDGDYVVGIDGDLGDTSKDLLQSLENEVRDILKAEFNDVPHERGICSMARSSNPDSAGSQFFIMLAPAPHLDGQYTVWGKVIEGMDVVDKIVNVPRNSRDRPLQNVVMRNVYLTE